MRGEQVQGPSQSKDNIEPITGKVCGPRASWVLEDHGRLQGSPRDLFGDNNSRWVIEHLVNSALKMPQQSHSIIMGLHPVEAIHRIHYTHCTETDDIYEAAKANITRAL